jgi:hypothetical protein
MSLKHKFWTMPAVLMAASTVWLAGCTSAAKPNLTKAEASKVNWSERIGTYTYEQALADLGKPAMVGESNSGRTVEWVLRRSPQMSFGFGVGGGSFGDGSGVGVGVGSNVSPPPRGESLRLVFDLDGKLKEWTKLKY